MEFTYLLPDGRRINAISNAVPLFDEYGQVRGSVCAVLDITETKQSSARLQKRTQMFLVVAVGFAVILGVMLIVLARLWQTTKQDKEALRESEEKYRSIVEGSIQGMVIAQVNPIRLSFASKPMEGITGYSPDELMNFKPEELQNLIHPDDRQRFVDSFRKRIKGEEFEHQAEYRILHKEKDVRWVALYSSLISLKGEPATQTVFIDITDRKEAEQEKEKLQAQLIHNQKTESIGTLASGIAHDFNNILSGILGYTDLAFLDVEENSPVYKNLSGIKQAGNRAKDLVKQILTISRHDDTEPTLIHIAPLVKEALKMLRSTIPSSIEIKENISNERMVVQADPSQIHQVIVNLATNAKLAMDDQTGIMEIRVDSLTFESDIKTKYIDMTSGDYVRITVSDTGRGIAEKHLEKIFDPYFTTRKKGEGTGLEFSVVHGIIKKHKGHITVYSEPGKGTTFNIYLPLVQDRPEEHPPPDSDKALPRGTEQILLVDDEPVIIEIIQKSLEHLGYTVTAATGSQEALEIFKKSPDRFDLVITDMTMPDMTGDRLAREVKAIRSDMPVILCTGFSEKINGHGKNLDIDAFFMKPVDRAKMAETVRKVLDEAKG